MSEDNLREHWLREIRECGYNLESALYLLDENCQMTNQEKADIKVIRILLEKAMEVLDGITTRATVGYIETFLPKEKI